MSGWLDLATTNQPAHQLDAAFYDRLRAGRPSSRPVSQTTVLPGGPRALEVRGGQVFRVVTAEGPQIATLALWNAHDRREQFNAARTMAAIACFIEPDVQLWSDVPRFRPLATCLVDTVSTAPDDVDFHHHCIGSPCSEQTMERRYGVAGLDSCHAQIAAAIAPFGMGAGDIHDVVSLHQKTRLDMVSGKVSLARSDARAGDYIEFYAEIDLLIAVVACPFGDGAADPRAADRAGQAPLRIELHETGIEPKPMQVWSDWRQAWTGQWQPPAADPVGR